MPRSIKYNMEDLFGIETTRGEQRSSPAPIPASNVHTINTARTAPLLAVFPRNGAAVGLKKSGKAFTSALEYRSIFENSAAPTASIVSSNSRHCMRDGEGEEESPLREIYSTVLEMDCDIAELVRQASPPAQMRRLA